MQDRHPDKLWTLTLVAGSPLKNALPLPLFTLTLEKKEEKRNSALQPPPQSPTSFLSLVFPGCLVPCSCVLSCPQPSAASFH